MHADYSLFEVLSTTLNIACVALLLKNEHRFTKLETMISILSDDYHDRRTVSRGGK